MRKIFLSSFQILINICLLPFYLIKHFHDVAHLPRWDVDSGTIVEITKVHYYYSPFENLLSMDLKCLFIAQIILTVLSISLIILSLIKKTKILNLISFIVFVVNILFFVVAIIISSTVARGY